MARPILNINCIDKPGCDYPAAVRLLMDDNTVQTYVLKADVSPHVVKTRENFEESIQISIGYQYRPKRKDRTHRGKR